jgi:cation transport ATPase
MTDSEPSTLSEKLDKTKKRLGILSKKVANSTKSMVENTNNSIKATISEQKEKRQHKKQEKLAQTKTELSEAGLFDDVPSMVTLPEFENERMEIASEQNDTMITIVEEMQRLSQRIDEIDRKITSMNYKPDGENINSSDEQSLSYSQVNKEYTINQIIHLLGVSVVWIVMLIVADWYSTEKNLQFDGQYPFRYLIWSIGTSSWIYYILYTLSKASSLLKFPIILNIQITMVVGITTLIALIAYDGSTNAISNVWIWGSTIAVVLLLSASILTYVWQSTKKLISIREEIEIID